jgi:CRP-like cAMP-binding protein
MRKITNKNSLGMVTYKKGEKIVKTGEVVDFVAEVKSGNVKIYKLIAGREVILPDLHIFKEWSKMMAISGIKSEFVVEALNNVEIVKTPKKEFVDELKTSLRKQNELLADLSKMFLEQSSKTTDIVGASAIGKVTTVILDLANKDVLLTHKLIAGLTGLTRETVTLQMLKMEKMKLIDNANRRIKILNKQGLEKLVQ